MLGFGNLLPIRALGEGLVMFIYYVVVTRRKPIDKFMEYNQVAGIIVLFVLINFANGNDLFKLFLK